MRQAKRPDTVRITFTVPEEVADSLGEAAHQNGLSVSAAAAVAVAQWVEVEHRESEIAKVLSFRPKTTIEIEATCSHARAKVLRLSSCPKCGERV